MTTLTARLQDTVARIERARGLDRAASAVAPVADRVTRSAAVERVLSGAPIGHRLHPMLTDVPIGCWTAASLLDLVAWRAGARAASRLTGIGVVAAVPTAASGLADWRDTKGATRRLGVVHLGCNVLGTALELRSCAARRRGRHVRGTLYGLAGLAAVTAGGYLGGHLVFAGRVGVDFEVPTVDDDAWHTTFAESELLDGRPRVATVEDAPVMVVRRRGAVSALADVCPHAGGPLHEGEVDDETVTCPWHGSRFCLADGSVRRGPAATAQVVYDTRVRAGTVEVRRAGAGFRADGRRTPQPAR